MNTEPVPEKKSAILDPRANLKALLRILVLIFVLIGGIWLFFRVTASEKTADTVTATILHQSIELKNSVENLRASSMIALPLSLPYSGALAVDIRILKGNVVDVYIVTPEQMENMKKKMAFTYLKEFEAKKTKTYRHSGPLSAGNYYLVLSDPTLGILSESSSDIEIHVKLDP